MATSFFCWKRRRRRLAFEQRAASLNGREGLCPDDSGCDIATRSILFVGTGESRSLESKGQLSIWRASERCRQAKTCHKQARYSEGDGCCNDQYRDGLADAGIAGIQLLFTA